MPKHVVRQTFLISLLITLTELSSANVDFKCSIFPITSAVAFVLLRSR
jgi:hypothetical protein